MPQWISPGNTHPNAHYRDPIWPLAPLIDNPSTVLFKIHWKHLWAPLLGQVKQVTWVMINGQLRPTYLKDRGVRSRSRTSAQDMQGTCNEWVGLDLLDRLAVRPATEHGVHHVLGDDGRSTAVLGLWRCYARGA
ncbi:hypothetical protein [Streptomyces sp. NPDC020681]|uniref:hypothetical protein n=1 Tax=Streptomyces sp. NPDC020681 TaxID=3365083 RepID=UPI0037917535